MPTRIIIQYIRTTWTKASRGGNNARRRNLLPRCLPLPLECFTARCAVHRAEFSEHSEFRLVESVAKASSLFELGIRDLAMELDGDCLLVHLLRDPQNAAAANRVYRDEPGNVVDKIRAFALQAGEWGQLRYNGRYVDFDTGHWWYEQSVCNIALFSDVAADRFVATPPTKRFAEIARLR
jgi:hypothetical protein